MKREDRPELWTSLLKWGAASVNSWLHFVPLLLVSPFSRDIAWKIYQSWGRTANRLFAVNLVLRDDNESEYGPKPHLYVGLNQTNLAEPVFMAQLMPPHYLIVGHRHASMPLFGWALPLLRHLVIIPQWKAQAKRGIERAAKRLASGETWAISIEGARSSDGKILEYKKGPIVMAIQSQATIIPIAWHGAHDVMPKGEWRVRPGTVELHMLKAIETKGLNYEDRNTVMSKLYALAEKEFATGESGA